jgi:hypothetical protein
MEVPNKSEKKTVASQGGLGLGEKRFSDWERGSILNRVDALEIQT